MGIIGELLHLGILVMFFKGLAFVSFHQNKPGWTGKSLPKGKARVRRTIMLLGIGALALVMSRAVGHGLLGGDSAKMPTDLVDNCWNWLIITSKF